MINPKTKNLERIGTKSDYSEDFSDVPLVPKKKAKISNYFTLENKVALYTYDFGITGK